MMVRPYPDLMSAVLSPTIDTPFDLSVLLEFVAADGITAHDEFAVAAARHALARGAPAVLAGIVLDPTAPPVARERALGRLASAF